MCSTSNKGSALGTVQLENDRVRVTEWRFSQAGDDTGWHTHEYDYVVVPLSDGVLEIDLPDGSRVKSTLKAGISYFRDAGVEHNVINAGNGEFAFVETELLN